MNANRVGFALVVATFTVALALHLSPARTAIAAAPQNNQDSGGCTNLPGFSALKSAMRNDAPADLGATVPAG